MADSTPNLTSLQSELAGLFAGIAVLFDDCYIASSGQRMLGIPDSGMVGDYIDHVDVAARIGKMLPVWAQYAYDGVVTAGYDGRDFDIHDDGPLERLRDMLGLLRTNDGYFEDCLCRAGVPKADQAKGGLAELVDRIEARATLDEGNSLTLAQLAVLAEMNERSVRNALNTEGESRLQLQPDGEVSNEEARRWLAGRRFQAHAAPRLAAQADADAGLAAAGRFPSFVRSRMKLLAATWATSSRATRACRTRLFGRQPARRAPPARIEAAMDLPLSIAPAECGRLLACSKSTPYGSRFRS